MYRYVAFGWSATDQAKAVEAERLTRLLKSSSSSWEQVVDIPGLRVLHVTLSRGAYRAYVLTRNRGVVLGKLFSSDLAEGYVSSNPNFDDTESERVIGSQGRHLVDHYWGYYVAFLRTAEGRVRYVLRDPTGGIQCYLAESGGVDVVVSDIEDCIRLDLPPFSVDWSHVNGFLQQFRLVTRTTGFKEVSQLHAGECISIEDNAVAPRKVSSFHWDPVEVSEARSFEDPSEARLRLRDVVQQCVSAWASSYDSIVHELSGGLDSSIVAACIAKTDVRPSVLCMNYFTEMSEGDERSYARMVARRGGFELVETMVPASEQKLEKLLDKTKVATPALLGFLARSELSKQRFIIDRDAGAVFSGQGGDHLFQQSRTKLIAAEYAYRHGIRPRLFRIVEETSHLTSESVWSVWGAVVRYGLLRRSFDPYTRYESPSFLNDDGSSTMGASAHAHPWVTSAHRLPSSKIGQIFNVIDCQRFFGSPCPSAEQVHPLISQPIIECSLQIPTYLLAHRGRPRGLIRESFERDVPAKIVDRSSKGDTTGYVGQLFAGSSGYLKELLLDGALVSEGLLDRQELERALCERELIRGKELRSIISAMVAETWLNSWADVRQQTAA